MSREKHQNDLCKPTYMIEKAKPNLTYMCFKSRLNRESGGIE